MKMVNKILLGTLAVAALLNFASCKKGDDTEDAISGSNNDYGINYTNNSDSMYRAYKLTSLKHAGDLVKITFENPTECADSKMGVIFGYQENNDGSRKFAIIGLGANTTGANFYVSVFNNVTDIQANNFGTGAASNPATENPVVSYQASNKLTLPTADAEGHVTVYVAFKAKLDGSYDCAVLNMTDNQASTFSFGANSTLEEDLSGKGTILSNSGNIKNIPGVHTLPTGQSSLSSYPQDKLAVYAMVQAKKTLKGKWQYKKDFHEAEEIEE